MGRFAIPRGLALFLLLNPAVVFGDSEQVDKVDDFADLDLEQMLEVVFTSAKHEQDIGQSASAITVITRADIETSGATTLTDLLRTVPGMEIVIVSQFFVAASARMFWTYANNRYLVLIDGRETNIELLGFPPWEVQPISIEDIQRIEIIRGPGSFLYGANATSGVINITTRPASKESLAEVRLSAGEAGTLDASARVTTHLSGWGIVVNGGAVQARTATDQRALSKEAWRFRALAEYQLSESVRLVIEGAYAKGSGPVSTGVGTLTATQGLGVLRLGVESESLSGQVYYTYGPTQAIVDAAINYNGLTLAEFVPVEGVGHVINGEVQWTLPNFSDSFLFIIGGGGRASSWNSDQCIDADTFTDQNSPRYQEVGIDHWEARTGAFVHGEYSPIDWMTITGDLRFDYNSETEPFLSPRLAFVIQPVKNQFFRLGIARAFRKPSFVEIGTHLDIRFPDDSIVVNQAGFRDFMTKVVGNPDLENETMLAFEAGYLGRFLEGRLSVGLNLYFNILRNLVEFHPDFVPDSTGLMPDLERSSFRYDNEGPKRDVLGSELSIQFKLSESVRLLANWTQRIVFENRDGSGPVTSASSPKNMITLGGRFGTGPGLVGSLYLFTRSEFWDNTIENPEGFLEPTLRAHLDDMILILGRLGWRIQVSEGSHLEAGLKLFFPISPWDSPHFRAFEKAGTLTWAGKVHGGVELARMLTGYLHGTF